jgi:hypothetical protein
LIHLEKSVKEFQTASAIKALTAHPLSIFCSESGPLLKSERDLGHGYTVANLRYFTTFALGNGFTGMSGPGFAHPAEGFVCLQRLWRETPDHFGR